MAVCALSAILVRRAVSLHHLHNMECFPYAAAEAWRCWMTHSQAHTAFIAYCSLKGMHEGILSSIDDHIELCYSKIFCKSVRNNIVVHGPLYW